MRPWMPAVDPKAKEQTLTLPRFRSEDPPTHALVALNGDVLRGRLEAATSEHLRVISDLEPLTVPRDRVAAVIRLQPPDKPTPTPPPPPSPSPAPPTHWLLLTDGGRFGLKVERFDADKVIGNSPLLGRCEVPWDRIQTVRLTAPDPTTAQASYRDWKLTRAPEPVLPEGGGQSSPMIGKDVKDFKVPLLAGGEFDFARQRGKVVVLDFWATWCGPCIQSLPELMEVVESLKGDKTVAEKFVFIAMNEAEPASQVKRFLEQRNWKLPVALDLLQSVGRQFQVEGIPHTVVIGPDGKIAWQNTGHRPGAAQELAEMVRKLATPGQK
jgi:thiol-disulfide isomerase/thioredoxin